MNPPERATATELRACLASVEEMAARAARLRDDIELGVEPHLSEHAINFAEVRTLDLLCKEALAQALPAHPELAEDWHVVEEQDLGSASEVHTDLLKKRVKLQFAINLVQGSADRDGDRAATPPS